MKKDLIKKLRTELGMKPTEFAKASGINSYQQVWLYESGRRNLGYNLLNSIVCNLAANGHLVALDVTVTINDKKI
jgi:transcriptional regulator with XRE-family HTH domain